MAKPVQARSIDTILDDVFRQYRSYFGPLLLISLIFMAPIAIMNAFAGTLVPSVNYQLMLHGQAGMTALAAQLRQPQSLGTRIVFAIMEIFIALVSMNIVSPLLQGTYYTLGAETVAFGSVKHSIWAYFRQAVKRWGAYLATMWLLIGLSLVGILVLGGVFAAALFAAAMLVPAMKVGGGLFILFIILLYLIAVVLAVWVSIRLLFSLPIVVVEKLRNWRAIRRSWNLTKGSFWRLFFINLIAFIVLGLASGGLSFLIDLLPGNAVRLLGTGLISILLAPLYALLLTNLYIDMRIRRDGYDIELMTEKD